MARIITNKGTAEIDCGNYRCKDCKHLMGEPGQYFCKLFKKNPRTYPGPFAAGDAGRLSVCMDSELITYRPYEEQFWNR